ncbi:hypothetical protein LMG31506_04643 [Cupriavidus yeoncheonensis]|uniref:Uncharacterized protein n=1 Tax=Cupriavidus yeoncheonensis TaxID=1462994 RepID=A0A916IXL5_9BURK|nr:hypothetical protein LMG31506_04643 [Cupriavidus yeoncheonensis]
MLLGSLIRRNQRLPVPVPAATEIPLSAREPDR